MTVVAIAFPVLLAFLALAVDVGYAYSQRRLTRGAADSAAVAGALMMGKRIGLASGDHDVWNATIESKQGNLRNSAETRDFWLRADYVNDDNTFSELVGVPCGATPNQATGIHVYVERTLPTAFGNMLNMAARTGSTAPANEQQTIRFSGSAGWGYFWLTLEGGDDWTWALPWNASASQIQSALQALPQINGNNVTVTGNPTGPFTVIFTNNLGQQNIIQLQIYTWLGGGVTGIVTTDRNGTGSRREVTVISDATAYLRSITAVDAADDDFAPFAVWVGTRSSCKAIRGTTVTFSHPEYRAVVVDSDCSGRGAADPAWTGNSNTFNGYLGDLSGQVRVGQRLSLGQNAGGQPPTTRLQNHITSGRPVLMPVMTAETGNGSNITFTVSGFVWVQLSSIPAGSNPILTGRVIDWAVTGKETSRQWGSPAGSNALAKTVTLGR